MSIYDVIVVGGGQAGLAVGHFLAPFQVPRMPAMALDDHVVQLHSSEYRNPSRIPGGPVLVAGGGNTGYQIAEELSATHDVHLSVLPEGPFEHEHLLDASPDRG